MWRRIAICCLAISIVLPRTGAISLAEQPGQVQGSPAKRSGAETVVLLSIDGLAAGYLEDPQASLPNLRALAAQGAVARGMITACPSVTWPSHVTLVTGVWPARHGVIGNTVFDREKRRNVVYIGDPELTKPEAIRVPTLYDVLHQAGRSSASVIWPCSSGASSLQWIIPDSNRAELHQRFTTAGLVEELDRAGINIRPLASWGWDKAYASQRDELYTKVACYLLEKHRPALVLLHLIRPDGVEHAVGPYTRQAYQAVEEADAHVGTVWRLLQSPTFQGRAALFVVSDHGFAPYEKLIQPYILLQELGEVQVDPSGKITSQQAWCVSQGGSAFLYVEGDDKPRRVEAIRRALANVEGIAAVVGADQFGSLGLPTPGDNPQAPDLLLDAKPGYAFSDKLTGPLVSDAGGLRGNHGHIPAPAFMHATFVAAGSGIRPHVKLDVIRSVDVAPTIAALLGVDLPAGDGRILTEILIR